jgi:hypothetical protein
LRRRFARKRPRSTSSRATCIEHQVEQRCGRRAPPNPRPPRRFPRAQNPCLSRTRRSCVRQVQQFGHGVDLACRRNRVIAKRLTGNAQLIRLHRQAPAFVRRADRRTSDREHGETDCPDCPLRARIASCMIGTSYRRASRKSHEGMNSRLQSRSRCRDRVLVPARGGPDTRALHRWSRYRKTELSRIARGRSAEERRTTSNGFASGPLAIPRLKDRRLRRHEALQIKAISRCHPTSPFSEAAPGPS